MCVLYVQLVCVCVFVCVCVCVCVCVPVLYVLRLSIDSFGQDISNHHAGGAGITIVPLYTVSIGHSPINDMIFVVISCMKANHQICKCAFLTDHLHDHFVMVKT